MLVYRHVQQNYFVIEDENAVRSFNSGPDYIAVERKAAYFEGKWVFGWHASLKNNLGVSVRPIGFYPNKAAAREALLPRASEWLAA